MRIIRLIFLNIEEILGSFFLGVMVVAVSFQVFFRYVLNSPLTWSEELARYTFIWLTFLGASIAVKRRAHIAMELFALKFPERLRTVVEIVGGIAMIVFLIFLIPTGIKFVRFMNMVESTAMQVPMGYVYLAVPVGAILMSIHMLQLIVRRIKSRSMEAKGE